MSFGLGFGFPNTVAAGSGATLALQFAGATALDPRITFTRASSATFTNSAGLVASAATNAPRLDYDPVTLQPKGLLIEEARTNLLTYSEQFDVWSRAGTCTVSANTIVAPDGTTTADILNLPSVGDGVFRSATITSGAVYAASVWLWGASNGTITIKSPNMGLGTAVVNITTTPTRFVITYTAASTSDGIYILRDAAGQMSTVYAWGAQLEAGAFATSYIPTVAAQATRAAENAAMTGTNFSSWYNQTEGTVFEEADVIYTGNFLNYAWYFNISNESTSQNGIQGWQSTAEIRPAMTVAGVDQLNVVSINRTSGFDKIALSYQTNNTQFTGNGVSTTTDTVCSIPTVTKLQFGASYALFNVLNGHIKRFTYWPRRLSNAELQAVTS